MSETEAKVPTGYTAVRIRKDMHDKLKTLSDTNKRSMANMLEVIIEEAFKKAKATTK